MRRITLIHNQYPGDAVVFTAAIEALHLQHPNQFQTSIKSPYPEIFYNNPNIKVLDNTDETYQIQYPDIYRPQHFIDCQIEQLSTLLNVELKCIINKPFLYLNPLEQKPYHNIPRPYVLINSGYKFDYPCKSFGNNIAQEIVNEFKDRFTFVQIGSKSDIHKLLYNVINLVGKTKHRDLIRLAYHSVLGIGPITYLHHIYGAFQKPYICYCGGREPPSFVQYPTAIMLSTMGQMKCCRLQACWKSTLREESAVMRNSVCPLPVIRGDEVIPKCMEELGSESAIRAIKTMLNNGMLL